MDLPIRKRRPEPLRDGVRQLTHQSRVHVPGEQVADQARETLVSLPLG
jgi:hypothetical protein